MNMQSGRIAPLNDRRLAINGAKMRAIESPTKIGKRRASTASDGDCELAVGFSAFCAFSQPRSNC